MLSANIQNALLICRLHVMSFCELKTHVAMMSLHHYAMTLPDSEQNLNPFPLW